MSSIGRPRNAVSLMPSYKPGKDAKQSEKELGITDAIKLASNENPMEPIPEIVDAITNVVSGVNRYADHRATEMRQTIADWQGLPVANVTVGAGSSAILHRLVSSYVDPGDEVLYPWRSFEVYPIYTRLLDGEPVTVPLVDETADLDGLLDAITEKTKLIMIANPNNPTGSALTTSALAQFCAAVPDRVIVVIDEAYFEFVDPSYGNSVRDLLPSHRNVVVTRTFSKAQGLAGLRVGYAMGDPETISAIDKTQLPFAVSMVSQAAAIAAVQHADKVASRVEEIVSERARVIDEVRGWGIDVPESQANFF
ncbi:MAG: aminotransferase class I/II-fold pyridoxal phosphate-dependent enzyme, partial [Acidimicrobiia bacterium]|nr:aminotransferase class I/II-fold pyridoxal phosphate-dependent enzyme [Acidimicrobiia bacterium]